MSIYPLKCRIRNDAGVTRVDIFDDIGEGSWFSEALSAKDFAAQLAGVNGALDVHINSYGGDVGQGIAIGNTIRTYKGFKRTVVDGMACSIASVIAQAGDERVVQPGSMTYVHDAFTNLTGNAADMAKAAEDLNKHSNNLAEIYASRAGGTVQHWRDIMQAETWYTAEEALAAGLADKIGTEAAVLPAGMDLAAFETLPGRIAARLREMPVAALGQPQDSDAEAGTKTCKTCKGKGRLRHPSTGKSGRVCPGCGGAGTVPVSGGEEDEGAQDAAQDTAGDCPTCDGTGKIMEGHRECPDCHGTGKKTAAASASGKASGKPYKPQPYHREAWENVQCPVCEKFNDDDGVHCGQCGAMLAGRDDVKVWAPATGNAAPSPAGGSAADDIRVLVREEIAAHFANSGVDNSDWDASKAWHNGTAADDPAAFYKAICAGEKTSGDPATQAHWALPYKYTPSSPPNAAGVKNALARLPQTQDLKNASEAKATLQRLMKAINPDYEPEDSADAAPEAHGRRKLSGAHLEQIRAALKGAKL